MGKIYDGMRAIAEVENGYIYELPENKCRGYVSPEGKIYVGSTEVGHVSFDGSIYNDKEELSGNKIATVKGGSIYRHSQYTSIHGENCTTAQIGAAYYLILHGVRRDIRSEKDMYKYLFRDVSTAFIVGGLLGFFTTAKPMIALVMALLFAVATLPIPGLTTVDTGKINVKTNSDQFRSGILKSMINSKRSKPERILEEGIRGGIILAAIIFGYNSSKSYVIGALMVAFIIFLAYDILHLIHELMPSIFFTIGSIVCWVVFQQSLFILIALCSGAFFVYKLLKKRGRW